VDANPDPYVLASPVIQVADNVLGLVVAAGFEVKELVHDK